MGPLPTGTLTFLLTDIQGSTRLWEHHPDVMPGVLERHDALVRGCVEAYQGHVIRCRGEGDAIFAVFTNAGSAAGAVAAAQRALFAEPWPETTPIRVRAAIHTGEAQLRDEDYYGSAINRCARIRSLAFGGQTLVSEAVRALIQDGLPEEILLRDLGVHRLRDLQRPERIYQLL
ncbi:MAG: adenylate/guanylate cyclase domain-containing protein, partial [Armatimonadetes bacterium]|nr:adenylate/guanylate cyclase domain-containing protein [Armatimonadota bacterium]